MAAKNRFGSYGFTRSIWKEIGRRFWIVYRALHCTAALLLVEHFGSSCETCLPHRHRAPRTAQSPTRVPIVTLVCFADICFLRRCYVSLMLRGSLTSLETDSDPKHRPLGAAHTRKFLSVSWTVTRRPLGNSVQPLKKVTQNIVWNEDVVTWMV